MQLIKLPFLSKSNYKFFALPLPSEVCAFPFDFVLERDPKNIFYYHRELENYADQVLDFLLFDKQVYKWNLPVCNSGQYIYVTGLFNFFFVSQDLIDFTLQDF